MYKNNSGLIAKTKQSEFKKGQCLTERFVSKNPLLRIAKPFPVYKGNDSATNKDHI